MKMPEEDGQTDLLDLDDYLQRIDQQVDELFDREFPSLPDPGIILDEEIEESSNDLHSPPQQTLPDDSNQSSNSSECLGTIEELIANAEREFNRDPAKESEEELRNDASYLSDKAYFSPQQDETNASPSTSLPQPTHFDVPFVASTVPTQVTFSSTNLPRPTQEQNNTSLANSAVTAVPVQANQVNSLLSTLSSEALDFIRQITAKRTSQEDCTASATTSEQPSFSPPATTSDLPTLNHSAPTSEISNFNHSAPTPEQKQALLICELQIPVSRLKDPNFLEPLQAMHSELRPLSSGINFDQLIDTYNLKITNIAKSLTTHKQKFTLMVNAVQLSEVLYLFVSIVFYSRTTHKLEPIFLGLRAFNVDKASNRQNIRPVIEEILNEYNLCISQASYAVHAGFDELHLYPSFGFKTYQSVHDLLKKSINRAFGQSDAFWKIKKMFTATVEQFCQDSSLCQDFFVRTGIQLDPNQLNCQKIEDVLSTHRKDLLEVSRQRCVTSAGVCIEADKWLAFDKLRQIQVLCQALIDATSPEKLLTIDYVFPLIRQFFATLIMKFAILGGLTTRIRNVVTSDLGFILNANHRHYCYLFANATALNSQVCHYLQNNTFEDWKRVLTNQYSQHYRQQLQVGTSQVSNKSRKRAIKDRATAFIIKNTKDIESHFAQDLEPPTKINVKYSAINLWEQFENDELKELAIDLLQIVPTAVFPNQIFHETLANWISHRPENSIINNDNLQTIERNIFVHLNKRFLS